MNSTEVSRSRRVLMVSPHFPPDSSAASHRVRLLAPHLRTAGWEPTIVTVDPARYESRLDPALAALVPADLDVVRADAWPARWTRAVGVGDLGLRAYTSLERTCRTLLRTRRFDTVFITLYPVYPALLARTLKHEFRIPVVLDYQDPWVGAWGAEVGGGPGGAVDWRSRASRRLGQWLEPRALAAVDALTAVSQGTIDGIVQRNPSAGSLPSRVIPLGFEPADLRGVDGASQQIFDPSDGCVHLCYVGTLLPKGVETLRLALTALAVARREDPAAARIRLHFVGTSNQSVADEHRVTAMAASLGVAEAVTENPGRLDYLDALRVLRDSSGVVLLGSSEPHYTASKLFPALLSRRPLLVLFHQASSVVSILQNIARAPTVRTVTYADPVVSETRIAEVASILKSVAHGWLYDGGDVCLEKAAPWSAASLAHQLGSLLDEIAA